MDATAEVFDEQTHGLTLMTDDDEVYEENVIDYFQKYKELVNEWYDIYLDDDNDVRVTTIVTGGSRMPFPEGIKQQMESIGGYPEENMIKHTHLFKIDEHGRLKNPAKCCVRSTECSTEHDWREECDVVVGLIARKAAVRDYIEKRIMLLDYWIHRDDRVISGAAKTRIERTASRLHDPSLAGPCHIIWNTGLVEERKYGGSVRRGEITISGTLNVNGLVFPVHKSENRSYAIVTEEDALVIRELIEQN